MPPSVGRGSALVRFLIDRSAYAAAALALVANLVGLTWGLPARWHPDEKADVVAAMLGRGELLPGELVNPSLPLYMMMPPLALQDFLASADLLPEWLSDPLLLARFLSALLGAAAVLMLGRARDVPRGAAWLLALCPGFVNLCHFATPEPWLMAATTAVLLLAVSHLRGGASATALGLMLGLAGATKYTAAALLVPGLLAVWSGPEAARERARPRWAAALGVIALAGGAWVRATLPLAERLRLPDARLLHPEQARAFVGGLGTAGLLLGGSLLVVALAAAGKQVWASRVATPATARVAAAAVGAFVLATPAAVLRPVSFLSYLAFNQQTRFEYKGLTGDASSYLAYLRLLADGLTLPLFALAALGLVLTVARPARDRWVWAAAALAPYLLVASSGHRALRFMAPLFPVAAVLGARALAELPLRRWARVALAAAVLLRLATGTLLVDRLFLVDSRARAARFIESRIPLAQGVDVITNHLGYAPAPRGRELRVVPTLSREMAPPERFQEAALAYLETGPAWLVLTASYYQRFVENADQHPERARFFSDLLDGRGGFTVVARFRQEGWLRPPVEFVDPEIVILRRDARQPPP